MNILIADDHEVVRRGLKQMLGEEFAGIRFGEAGSAAETLQRLWEEDWDLLLLDINMPGGRNGLEVLAAMQVRQIRVPVLVLSMSPEEEYAVRALKKGAAGYLTKQSVAEELITAVRKVLAGGRYITPTVAERLVADVAALSAGEAHERLSDREMQVLRLIATGRSVKEIAEGLSLSEKTIFTYRERVRAKLNVKSDVELARYALHYRLVE